MKGYDYLKKALDGELQPKTIIKTINKLGDLEMNKEFDNNYDYYIYEKDNMFHRCNKDGKLGAKYQDRFLNYKVLEKNFEFYCVLEEEKKIPEKLENEHNFYSYAKYEEKENEIDKVLYILKAINLVEEKIGNLNNSVNKIIDYLKSKGDE